MRVGPIVLSLLAAAVAPACKKVGPQPPPASSAPVAQAPSLAAAPAPAAALSGTVVEKIDAATYSYLKLKTAAGEQWAAVPQTPKAVGDTVSIAGAVWMKDFKSNTLERTWPEIAFGTLDEPAEQPSSPHGQAAQAGGSPHGKKPAAPIGEVRVPKAPGGHTVAEVYAQKDALKDKQVAVRGKVVKATDGVMGKSWLHLRDGTGEGAAADLTVAAVESAAVGDTVVAKGVVRVDRDLGSGYRYDVLVEDAHVSKE